MLILFPLAFGNKTHRLITLLYRHFYWYTNSPGLLRLYKSFIDYVSIVWNPHLKGETESLENVQKFALGVWNPGILNTTTQSFAPAQERAQLSLCHLYKIIHNQCYFPPIFSARKLGRMLIDLFYSPNLSQGLTLLYFIPNVISLWNNLPKSVVCAPSLSVFKQSLHHFF